MDMHKLASALILLGCKVVVKAKNKLSVPYCYAVMIDNAQLGSIYIYEDNVLIAPHPHSPHLKDKFTYEEFYEYAIAEKEKGAFLNDKIKSYISA